MSKKASQEKLAELHAKVAEKILNMLDDEEKQAQGLVLAIKFLKDNNIQADPDLDEAINRINEKVNTLKLPFPAKAN